MNPFLARLGFSPDDRVVIFHADDLGMCHAANTAFADIAEAAPVACGSVMMPCPWVNETIRWAHAHPKADVGIHLTLTSEWPLYRWRPLSTCDPQSGLLDHEGYFWPDVESLHAHMQPEAAIAEMRAQVERALAAGLDVTHIDTHMGGIVHPALLPAYVELGLTYRVPVMLPRIRREQVERYGLSPDVVEAISELVEALERDGRLPVLDHLTDLYDVPGDSRKERYKFLVKELPPGLTHLIYHAARPGDEVRAIAPEDDWSGRVADWEVFSDPEFWSWLAENGVHVIGYRTLRDLLRGEAST